MMSSTRRAVLGRLSVPAVFGLVFVCAIHGAGAQCTTPWLPTGGVAGIGGHVWAATYWDPDGGGPALPRLVVGGRFQLAGTTAAANLAMRDPVTDRWVAVGGGVDGDVWVLASTPGGALVVAGNITTAGGTPVSHIASWDGTTWSAMGGGTDNWVQSLATRANGHVVAGGAFGVAGGIGASRVAEWDGTTWHALGGGVGPGGASAVVELPGGDLLVGGGDLTSVPGTGTTRVARWDGATWSALGSGFSYGSVRALAVTPGGLVVAGGSFTSVGGVQCSRIAAWNGVSWAPLGAGVDAEVVALLAGQNNEVVVGGTFLTAGGAFAGRIAVWNGAAWSPVGGGTGVVGTYHHVSALTRSPAGELIAGGEFASIGGTPARSIARWTGAAWHAFDSGTNGPVTAVLHRTNGDLVIGGEFTAIDGVAANHVARFDGTAWSPLGTGFSNGGHVSTLLERANGDLLAAGRFSHAGGVSAANVAVWNGTNWAPLGTGLYASDSVESAVELPNGEIVVAGAFGPPLNSQLARWNGSAWTSMATGVSGTVSSLCVLTDGTLVIAGSYVARLQGTTWRFLGSVTGWVRKALAASNGDLVVAGTFWGVGATQVSHLARWDGLSWSAIGPLLPSYGNKSVVELPNGDLVVARWWPPPGTGLVRWDGAAWVPLPGFDEAPLALTVRPDGELVAGGPFAGITGAYLARQVTTCPAGVRAIDAACDAASVAPRLTASTRPWLGATFRTQARVVPLGSIAVSLWGAAPLSLPLVAVLPVAASGCRLLASPDVVQLVAPAGGPVDLDLAFPATPALATLQFHHQVVVLHLGATGGIVGGTTSNALVGAIGTR